jgi:hypothetical protein
MRPRFGAVTMIVNIVPPERCERTRRLASPRFWRWGWDRPTTAIFSVVDIVMLRPLPHPEGGRLISVTTYLPSLNLDFIVSPE